MEKSFLELCYEGLEIPYNVDHYVSAWHRCNGELTLPEFLGLTQEQYDKWIVDDAYLIKLVEAHEK